MSQNLSKISTFLRKRLQEPLPADEVRKKMSPNFRLPPGVIFPDLSKAKKAGVLALLYPVQEIVHIAFMQRPQSGYAHGGQISFPGGRMEEEDDDIIQTALRETEEEFGVPRHSVEVLGQLSQLFIPVSNSLVFPTVGMTQTRPDFIPNPTEVEEIIEVPLIRFFEEGVVKQKLIHTSSGFKVDAPYFDIDGRVLWGATSMMMSELVAVIRPIL